MSSAMMDAVSECLALLFKVTIKRGSVFGLMIESESRSHLLKLINQLAQVHNEKKTEVQKIEAVISDLHPAGRERPSVDSI